MGKIITNLYNFDKKLLQKCFSELFAVILLSQSNWLSKKMGPFITGGSWAKNSRFRGSGLILWDSVEY